MNESKEGLSIEPPKIDLNARQNLAFPLRLAMEAYWTVIWSPFVLRIIFLVFACLGCFMTPQWYPFQLLQVVIKSAQLQNIVLAVTKNGHNLTLTGCLLGILVYIFATVAYFYYSQYVIPDWTGAGGNCDTLARCTATLLVYGLKAGAGIGEQWDYPLFGPNNDGHAYLRLLYEFLFFCILIILTLNMVFGTILDTFGELREQRDFVTEDQETKCFICGLEQADFDRVAPGGFEQHVAFEHKMWDYLYFMHYVKLKPSDIHTGQEGFVAECMKTHDPQFFPIARALAVETGPGASKHADEQEAA